MSKINKQAGEQAADREVIGWFLPRHNPVNWTGMLVDQETGELVPDPAAVSRTKQSFKDECDINQIVRRFEATGHVDHINQAREAGLYIDLPSGLELQTALDQVRQAEAAFMALPAHVRARFENDPVQFVAFFDDPGNQDEAIKLGLAEGKPPVPAGVAVPPVEAPPVARVAVPPVEAPPVAPTVPLGNKP